MKITGQIGMLAALSGCLLLSTALAQSAPSQPDQNANQSQDQSANSNQNQYSGVAHPPADETIKADEDAPVPVAKPSPAIPMPPAAPVVAAQPASNDYDVISAASGNGADAPLHKRAWNPDDDIVSYVPSNPNELAAGTNIRVRLANDLSTTETSRHIVSRGRRQGCLQGRARHHPRGCGAAWSRRNCKPGTSSGTARDHSSSP